MRGYKHRYYNKWKRHTFSKPRTFSGCRHIYYKIKSVITSFLSYILALILVYSVAMIGLVCIETLYDETLYDPVVNTESPDHVLNIVGADGNRIVLVNNENAVDPSYEELKTFLKADRTDTIPYDYDSFVCADFAEAVHNNAEKSGIKAGFVNIDFNEINDGHACNVFNTTDRGLVFVDCVSPIGNNLENNDKIANMEIGKKYDVKGLFGSRGYYGDDNNRYFTVKNYGIYW